LKFVISATTAAAAQAEATHTAGMKFIFPPTNFFLFFILRFIFFYFQREL
jgi:hypothetical protein